MKGKVLVLVIAGMVALLIVAPAFARRGGGADSFNLGGTIRELSSADKTIGVEVETPLHLTSDDPDVLLTVYTTDDTRFKQCDDNGPSSESERIRFDDLTVGSDVRITGTFDGDGNFVAERVIQYEP